MVFAFALLHYSSVNKQNTVRSEALELNMLQQREYYETILNKEVETRRFRHDIIDELLVIRGMLENSDINSASNMISEMLDNIDSINCKELESGNVSEEIDITDVDLCIVASNIVKNAVGAISEVDLKESFV